MFGSEKKYKLGQYDFVCEMLGISKNATCGQTLIEKICELDQDASFAQLLQTKIADYVNELVFNYKLKEPIRVDKVIQRLRQLTVMQ